MRRWCLRLSIILVLRWWGGRRGSVLGRCTILLSWRTAIWGWLVLGRNRGRWIATIVRGRLVLQWWSSVTLGRGGAVVMLRMLRSPIICAPILTLVTLVMTLVMTLMVALMMAMARLAVRMRSTATIPTMLMSHITWRCSTTWCVCKAKLFLGAKNTVYHFTERSIYCVALTAAVVLTQEFHSNALCANTRVSNNHAVTRLVVFPITDSSSKVSTVRHLKLVWYAGAFQNAGCFLCELSLAAA